ncbi:phosphotransferase family protein [Candidatus Poribacteria bacterium]
MDNIRNGLLSFYEKKHSSDGDARIAHLAQISDGWENEVYSFRIEQGEAEKQSREDLILRIYPGDGASEKAEKEFSGMKKLYELGFPVPEVLILELDDSYFGKPFVIMEKIDGRSMGKVMEESSEERRQELGNLFCQMFVDLHALDWRPFAPDPSVYETGDPYTPIDEFLLIGQEYIDRFGMNEFAPIMDWLRERRLNVPCERPSVIHLDYHPHNILLREDGKAFVIDWTNIGVADFRMDIAWTIVLTSNYGDPEVRQIILDEYERLAGHRVEQIEYFEVMASLRRLFSIIVSINQGAEKMGMRPEAVTSMKQNVGHIRNVYTFMLDRTGIAIPEIETLISTLSEV